MIGATMEQMRPQPWTVHDLEQVEQTDDGTRYELIEGELYVSASPHVMHQFVSMQLTNALWTWSKDEKAGVVLPVVDVVFADDELVAPDIVWVAAGRLGEVLGSDGRLHAAPDLVVELLSGGWSNEYRDRVKKLDCYSRRGVGEYWIVDWRERLIELHRRQGSTLRPTATLHEGDLLESPRLPGFCLDVTGLFTDLPGTRHQGL